VAAALRRLAAPRPVVRAAPEQLVHPVELEPPPLHPWRGEQDVGADLVAAGDLHHAARGVVTAADHAAQQDELGAELLGLAPREPRELRAADALGEAEEVLDQRGVRRLAAG